MTGDKPAMNFLDNYNSQYIYTRFAYGVTEKLTMSVESGYFTHRSQVAINKRDTVSANGIADLILFPRYNIYTHNTEKTRNEITIGLGYKFPLGKYHDSSVVYTDPTTGKQYYTPKPPAVLPTTGSNDFIFYGFGYRGYPSRNFRLFTSLLYVRKGWNPLGQKFGDYASIGLFAGKTFFKKLGVTLQVKGEQVGKMKANDRIDMLAIYNLDITSTGGTRLLVVPQLAIIISLFQAMCLAKYLFTNT
ncbi:MAG: hypothetical protein JWQ38_2843 [Flavipsychrobacter sp.]|nr:hypothetical protein [Flavipsychrobacter sp.]